VDPVTQGLLGAAAAQAALASRAPDELETKIWWLGALGGMAADLDILLRWPGDPMVALTYHRHFTHSLSFIPLGGILVALPFLLRRRKLPDPERASRYILAATTLGYATHALLDAFTSYGTMLWWPFSDARIAWSSISIIDPIYTGLLAAGVWLARRRLRCRPARVALLLSSLYMLVCVGQRVRVREAQSRILEHHGVAPDARFVFPGLLANTRWRSLAITGDTLRADAIVVPWFGEARYLAGETHPRFSPRQAPPELFEGPGGERVRSALETMDWFAGQRLYIEASEPGWWRICDARYARSPESFRGLFCWELEPNNAAMPVRASRRGRKGRDFASLKQLLPFSPLQGYETLPTP
jgi:inner membrane protein